MKRPIRNEPKMWRNGQLDALTAQQHQPAVHRREDADELDAGRERRRTSRNGPRVDQGDLRVDQAPGGDVGGVLRHLPARCSASICAGSIFTW